MLLIDSIKDLEKIEKGWVLTIGNFDGVHLGHRSILHTGLDAAAESNTPGLAVLTFDPHPAAVLHPEKAPGILTPLPLKKRLLQAEGADCLIVLSDTYKLLNLSPKDFLDDFLVKYIKPKIVVEGPNFNFGYGRSGTIETLQQLAPDRNFQVIEVLFTEIHIGRDRRATVCSSTFIRNALEKGDIASATAALGRYYRLIGPVIKGRGIGTELGFPTANLSVEADRGQLPQIIPAEGVYAGFVQMGKTQHDVCINTDSIPAVFSIGRAKTFISDHPLLVEAHILEPKVEDLSDKWLAMDFVERLRPQQRFKNSEALVEQIEKDCSKAKKILAVNPQ